MQYITVRINDDYYKNTSIKIHESEEKAKEWILSQVKSAEPDHFANYESKIVKVLEDHQGYCIFRKMLWGVPVYDTIYIVFNTADGNGEFQFTRNDCTIREVREK